MRYPEQESRRDKVNLRVFWLHLTRPRLYREVGCIDWAKRSKVGRVAQRGGSAAQAPSSVGSGNRCAGDENRSRADKLRFVELETEAETENRSNRHFGSVRLGSVFGFRVKTAQP